MKRAGHTIACAMVTTLLFTSTALAGPLAPSKVSQLATAETSNANVSCPFTGPLGFPSGYQVDLMSVADGASVPFAVPAKQVFMITSFDFNFGGPISGTTVFIRLVSFDAAGVATPLLQGTAVSSNGTGGGSVTAPNGIPLRPGKVLCVMSSAGAAGGLVHGFFTKAN